MRLPVVVVVALSAAGCSQIFGLSAPIRGDAAVDQEGEDALMLDAFVQLDAPLDAPPGAMDTDGDGHANSADNCPTKANADQGNEDGDTLGDVCDPCPVSTTNADADGDGVGDACDPHPSAAGDTIAMFEGFHHGLPTGWITQGGTWTGATDDLVATSLNAKVDVFFPAQSQHEVISAGVTITSTASTGNRVAGIQDNAETGTNGYADMCAFLMTQPTDNPPNEKLLSLFREPTGGTIMRAASTWAENELLVLSLGRVNNIFTCVGRVGGGAATAVNGNDGHITSNADVGLHVVNATARFAWVMLVTSP